MAAPFGKAGLADSRTSGGDPLMLSQSHQQSTKLSDAGGAVASGVFLTNLYKNQVNKDEEEVMNEFMN